MKSTKDDALLNQLVLEHSDYLFRYALKHFSSESVAEELVQETFVAAVTAISGFKGESTARTWLTGILRHKIIDHIRRDSRRQAVSIDETTDGGMSKYFDEVEHWRSTDGPVFWNIEPDQIVEQKEFMHMLEGCLSALPERLRQVFILREYDGLERDEICNILNLSSTNVGVMLHRSRLGLRDCIQVNWLKR